MQQETKRQEETKMQSQISDELQLTDCQLLTVQQIIDITEAMAKGKNELNDLGENIVLIMGKTGVGKSTVLNYLGGRKLIGFDDQGVLKLKTQDDQLVKIGFSSCSETTFPSRVESGCLIFWDCPGFDDNRGPVQDILNSFYVTHIIKNSQAYRICILMKSESTKGRANDFIDLAEQLDRLFNRKRQQYEGSVAFVITNVEKRDKLDNVKGRLIKILNENVNKFKNKDLLEDAIHNHLAIFRLPEDEGEIKSEEDLPLILQSINNLKKIKVTKETKVNISMSQTSALAAISLYNSLNDSIQEQLKSFVKMILDHYKQQHNECKDQKELQEFFNQLTNLSNDIPSTISLKDFHTIIEIGNKSVLNQITNDNGSDANDQKMSNFYVQFSDRSPVSCIETSILLNSVKFLEEIIGDYAILMQPVDLHSLLKQDIREIKDQFDILLNKISNEEIKQRNQIEDAQNKEKFEKLKQELREESQKRKVESQKLKEESQKKIKIATTIGSSLGGAMGGFALGAELGIVAGPVGMAVGGAFGLLISMFISKVF